MELKGRDQSLDSFRGIDVVLMIIVNTPGDSSSTFSPLLHADWHGFTLTDLVFPTFLFLVGVSLSFSLKNYEALGQASVLRKILWRTVIIFLLGFLMYWFPFVEQNGSGEWIFKPLSETRIFGVLQRIALCYAFGALIIYFWKTKGVMVFSIVFLVGYWLLVLLFGDLTLEGNSVVLFDTWLVGEPHLYHGEGLGFDPEGFLSTIPAIVNVLIGYHAGSFIQKKGASYETVAKIMIAGCLLALSGLAWDLVFPINKKLWTSSFVLYTSGIDLLIMGVLLYVIDIQQRRNLTYFFEVMGRNTLFIYLLSEFLAITLWVVPAGGTSFNQFIFANGFAWAGPYIASLLFAVCFMLICWMVAYVLDKRRIYIRI